MDIARQYPLQPLDVVTVTSLLYILDSKQIAFRHMGEQKLDILYLHRHCAERTKRWLLSRSGRMSSSLPNYYAEKNTARTIYSSVPNDGHPDCLNNSPLTVTWCAIPTYTTDGGAILGVPECSVETAYPNVHEYKAA